MRVCPLSVCRVFYLLHIALPIFLFDDEHSFLEEINSIQRVSFTVHQLKRKETNEISSVVSNVKSSFFFSTPLFRVGCVFFSTSVSRFALPTISTYNTQE